MLLTELGMVKDVKPAHPAKANPPILVTELPIVKALLPMLVSVTELGISTDFKPVHPEKALSPMLVTELGISTDVKPVH